MLCYVVGLFCIRLSSADLLATPGLRTRHSHEAQMKSSYGPVAISQLVSGFQNYQGFPLEAHSFLARGPEYTVRTSTCLGNSGAPLEAQDWVSQTAPWDTAAFRRSGLLGH